MTEVIADYWPLFLAIIVLGLVIGFWMLRPKQRVSLAESSTPVRPHMAVQARESHEGGSFADEAAAATSDVAGQFLGTHVHENLPGASGPPDDLQRLKGVGPKLATMLNERGIHRFDQLARLSDADLDRLDESLGSFKGRLRRDQVVRHADYLARGDTDGFEQAFGKL
jgi:predicted flap endonuclease-1-like 5' DNA nuclease